MLAIRIGRLADDLYVVAGRDAGIETRPEPDAHTGRIGHRIPQSGQNLLLIVRSDEVAQEHVPSAPASDARRRNLETKGNAGQVSCGAEHVVARAPDMPAQLGKCRSGED